MLYIDKPYFYHEKFPITYSHLVSDESEEELHSFAKAIGVEDACFFEKPYPHYLIKNTLYEKCMEHGAVGNLPMIELIKKCILLFHKREEIREKSIRLRDNTWKWRE